MDSTDSGLTALHEGSRSWYAQRIQMLPSGIQVFQQFHQPPTEWSHNGVIH